MTTARSTIDLHLHTTCSDGTLTPAQTVEAARSRGLRLISIADHDTIAGIGPALAAAKDTGLLLVPGIELNTDYKGQEVHILGYGFDTAASALQAALHKMLSGRDQRNLDILERLKGLGVGVSLERVKEIAKGKVIARPHIAAAMVEAGHVASSQEAFDRFLKKGAKAFRERYSLTPQEACRAVLDSGGMPVLAHPAKTDFGNLLKDLLPCGLRGLEAYHPDQTPAQSHHIRRVAAKHGLLVTGGTDSHGPQSARPVEMGSVELPANVAEKLFAAFSKD